MNSTDILITSAETQPIFLEDTVQPTLLLETSPRVPLIRITASHLWFLVHHMPHTMSMAFVPVWELVVCTLVSHFVGRDNVLCALSVPLATLRDA